MKKLFKFFPAVVAMMAFSACQNDQFVEEPTPTPDEDKTFQGDAAYMKINISDVNSFGAKGTSPGFENGELSEHDVTDAQFFFFDENGVFVLKGSVANPTFGEDNLADPNVEYVGQENILVLEGLTGKNWPRYLVTVLNAPEFTPESTIQLTAEKLSNYYVGDLNNSYKMVMSTASYIGTNNNHDNNYPYATLLDENDFYLSSADALANGHAIKIYVERLAAKVQLDLAAALKNTAVTINGKTLYALTESLAGNPNNQGGSSSATTKLYLEIKGWDLNATTNNSYMSKQISDWKTTDPFTGWNDSGNYRSYWAKSTVYGATAADVTGTTDPTAKGIQYTTFNEQNLGLGAARYCNENTNEVDYIFQNDAENRPRVLASQATHVVLKANVCDGEGKSLDLVKYHGVLYTEEGYINYVLNNIMRGDKANLNFYTFDGTNYNQVDHKFFKMAADGSQKTGHVTVVVADETVKLYAQQPGGGYADANMADLKTKLANIQPGVDSNYPATSYKGGDCVYYIPIEHFAAKHATDGIKTEGYYGVVRNHWYKLTISSFSKVGHGVFDPDHESLKPEGPEDPLYYLGVNINILSWKIVDQSVDL